jgi:hypothetical protein
MSTENTPEFQALQAMLETTLKESAQTREALQEMRVNMLALVDRVEALQNAHVEATMAAATIPSGPAISDDDLLARCVLAISDGHCREGGVHTRPEHLASFGDDAASACMIFLRDRITGLDPAMAEIYVLSFLGSASGSIAKVGLRSVRGRLIPIAVGVAEATLEMFLRVPGRITALESQFAQAALAAHTPARILTAHQQPGPQGQQQQQISARAEAMLRVLG